MKKQILSIWLSVILVIGMMAVNLPTVMASNSLNDEQTFESIDYQKTSAIRVNINGQLVNFEVNPQIVDGRTLVPMRIIFETFGLSVDWDNGTKSAQGTSADILIKFTIGSNKALVNNQEKTLDVPASIINGRTMIPLRFLSENMDYNVVWVGTSNLILISESDIIEWRYEGHEAASPYKEYEVKYINGVKTTEKRYTGTNWTNNIMKTVDYTWEYPLGLYTWEYSLKIPERAYEIYKSIDRDDIYGYTYYISEESDDEYLANLTQVFINTAEENDFDEIDTIYLIISFVQHLNYLPDAETTGYEEYPKFPLETLYDKGGDCEDSSILLASLLNELGYGAVLICFDDHMGVGIKGDESLPGYYFEDYGINYYYIETTDIGWEIGEMPEEYIYKSAQILYY